MTHSIFGYGSLILPTSHFIRIEPDLSQERKQILEGEDSTKAEKYRELCLSDRAMEAWDKSDVEFIPVKVYGFKRYYALERNAEGNQLSVKHTENEEDFINGVIATGLTEEDFEKIVETEGPYSTIEITQDDYEPYLTEEQLENVKLPEQVEIFIGSVEHPEINYDTSKKRDPGYHKHLIKGVELLADYWHYNPEEKQEFKEDFITDLESTTYEMTDDGWKKLSSI